MSVLPARARLDDGRKLPVADGHSLRRGGSLLGVHEYRPTEKDEPCNSAHKPHGGDANRYRPQWLSLLAFLLVTACAPAPVTYADYGDSALTALQREFYAGDGTWYACAHGCGAGNLDWGNDSLTYTLYLRWSIAREASLLSVFQSLVATAAVYGPCKGSGCDGWSDVPEWDAIANVREYEVTGNARALDLAKRAYASVRDSDAHALGACPAVHFQRPFGTGGGVKTLETDSNAIKAALLLWKATGDRGYLDDARATYASVRQYFLDPALPLYSVYVYDDGASCSQLPGRFFASVNGNMIWNGVVLASETGNEQYFAHAVQTAKAVDESLGDGRGIFADLQAENDIVEPLVEAFYVLAVERRVDFARAWILKNAAAAISTARTPEGLYGRFFDGPPPTAPTTLVTAWQTNGGLALAIAAGALAPTEAVPREEGWAMGKEVAREITALPSSLEFTGSGIALFGTLGESCCEPGHASVAIDGTETVDRTGIWQNKSFAARAFQDTLLFSWRWPASGPHRLDFGPSTTNAKEGGPFLHVRRYVVLP